MQDPAEMFRETMRALEAGAFEVGDSLVRFSFSKQQHEAARYYPAHEVAQLVQHPGLRKPISLGGRCQVIVRNMDSLESVKHAALMNFSISADKKPVLVLNFANPYEPGGGVARGAVAQEEDLCRRTTLYASLASSGASGFYDDNKRCGTRLFTHGMVLSPHVTVFRNADGSNMEEPHEIAVLTCPAPYAPGLQGVSRDELFATCKTRIKGMLMVAAMNGYESVVLGAWGCGAFGNDPMMMARAFREALDEVRGGIDGDPERGPGVDSLFKCVFFGVLDRSEDKAKLHAFESALGDFHKAADDAELAAIRREREARERYLGKFQGCLVGGAAGDALGYAVEFMSWESIVEEYGSAGIRHYRLPQGSLSAQFSDDTQMTLFTAAGILEGSTRGHLRGVAGPAAVYAHRAYLDWLKTQEEGFEGNPGTTWLLAVPELHALRAPGNTCLFALRSGRMGTMEEPLNSSKGCGGVMRVAPWGLFLRGGLSDGAVREGASIAAVTHGHPLGWIPAGVLCYIVNRCCYGVPEGCDDPAAELRRIMAECIEKLPSWFPEYADYAETMAYLLRRAILYAESGDTDIVNIARLGQGWVGEEALAIAVYAALRHADDFSEAIIAAANHGGDSDSTAAICGNIVGALLGYGAIDEEWTQNLELHDLIMELAKDLCDDCPMDEYGHYRDEAWLSKYGGNASGLLAINDFLRGNADAPVAADDLAEDAKRQERADRTYCPECGNAVGTSDRFCMHCGTRLDGGDLYVNPKRQEATGLPDVPGLPGRIVGVKISHGWAAAYGYHDIVEIAGGRVTKTRKIDPARGGGRFPEGWFDDAVADMSSVQMARVESIVQNLRYCDIDMRDDGTTPVSPRSDKSLYMAVTYAADDGENRTVTINADPEFGSDVASRCARDVIGVAEEAFGNVRAIDSLLVIHKKGPMAQVVMNGSLRLTVGPCGNAAFVVDGDNDEILAMEVNELCAGERFFEARVLDLRDGWRSRKAMFPIVENSVTRLSPDSFMWEGWWDEAIARDAVPREDSPEREEWIVVCAGWPFGSERLVDEMPLLPGYEPFMSPGCYAVTSWLNDDDENQDEWFSRPVPETAQFKELAVLPQVEGVGSYRDRRDVSRHLVQRKIQLDESRLYFLTVFLDERGYPTGRHSFDIEEAHDSHYEFDDDGARKLLKLMGADAHCGLAEAMIGYAEEHGGAKLGLLVWEVKTASFSY